MAAEAQLVSVSVFSLPVFVALRGWYVVVLFGDVERRGVVRAHGALERRDYADQTLAQVAAIAARDGFGAVLGEFAEATNELGGVVWQREGLAGILLVGAGGLEYESDACACVGLDFDIGAVKLFDKGVHGGVGVVGVVIDVACDEGPAEKCGGDYDSVVVRFDAFAVGLDDVDEVFHDFEGGFFDAAAVENGHAEGIDCPDLAAVVVIIGEDLLECSLGRFVYFHVFYGADGEAVGLQVEVTFSGFRGAVSAFEECVDECVGGIVEPKMRICVVARADDLDVGFEVLLAGLVVVVLAILDALEESLGVKGACGLVAASFGL